MIQKLIPIIVIVIASLAGGGGGYFFKMQSAASGAPTGGEHASADGDHGAKPDGDNGDDHGDADADDHGKKKKKKKKKGGHGDEPTSSTIYMKFSRQFVVPVVKQGRPKSMLILDVNIAIDSSFGESVYTYEPRLRDAMLAELLNLASQDMLPALLEDGDKMAATKQALLETAKTIIGDAAQDILILDIGMQSY